MAVKARNEAVRAEDYDNMDVQGGGQRWWETTTTRAGYDDDEEVGRDSGDNRLCKYIIDLLHSVDVLYRELLTWVYK